ncbi:unnamed protein product [Camellia sinensis]
MAVARVGAAVVDLPKSQHNLAAVTEVEVQSLFGGNGGENRGPNQLSCKNYSLFGCVESALVEDDPVLAWFSEFNDENGGSVLYDGLIRTQFGENEVSIFGMKQFKGCLAYLLKALISLGTLVAKKLRLLRRMDKGDTGTWNEG